MNGFIDCLKSLAVYFHDISKPETRRFSKEKRDYTFYGHDVVGGRVTREIMERLKFPNEMVEKVSMFVRWHMFFSDTEQITLSAVRRIIQKVKPEHIWELMEVRECDRVGMKKVEAPYRLRKYHAMIDEALRDPISVGQLKIDGAYLINVLHMKPGPRMGWILHALLEEVLEDPSLNTVEKLSERVKDLDELEDKDLKILGEKGKEKKDDAVLDCLLELLEDNAVRARIAAVRAIGKVGNERALSALQSAQARECLDQLKAALEDAIEGIQKK